jgi:hypothetical protein
MRTAFRIVCCSWRCTTSLRNSLTNPERAVYGSIGYVEVLGHLLTCRFSRGQTTCVRRWTPSAAPGQRTTATRNGLRSSGP